MPESLSIAEPDFGQSQIEGGNVIPFDPTNLNTAGARLPAAYQAARAALDRAVSVDECQHWANKAQALASYARQADDDSLQKQAIRIQSRAIRRCGELLKEFNTSPVGGRPTKNGDGTVIVSQKQAAEEAGLSERQRVTAVRVANVPVDQFEAVVESDTPPTVTKLADWGRKPQETPDWASNLAEGQLTEAFQPGAHFIGAARRLSEFCGKYDPAFIASGMVTHRQKEARKFAFQLRRWLQQFQRSMRENSNGL